MNKNAKAISPATAVSLGLSRPRRDWRYLICKWPRATDPTHYSTSKSTLAQLQAAKAIVHADTVDQPTIQSKNSVKPRRMRVLVSSFVMGGIIGVFAAFVGNFVQQQEPKTKASGEILQR